MEKYQITIESDGDYKLRKEFNRQLMMNDKQFLAFVNAIILFIETETIEDYKEEEKVATN